jgi:hypothetical protein
MVFFLLWIGQNYRPYMSRMFAFHCKPSSCNPVSHIHIIQIPLLALILEIGNSIEHLSLRVPKYETSIAWILVIFCHRAFLGRDFGAEIKKLAYN